ncbi:unnamed protein product [Gadus morhua 'NCC']
MTRSGRKAEAIVATVPRHGRPLLSRRSSEVSSRQHVVVDHGGRSKSWNVSGTAVAFLLYLDKAPPTGSLLRRPWWEAPQSGGAECVRGGVLEHRELLEGQRGTVTTVRLGVLEEVLYPGPRAMFDCMEALGRGPRPLYDVSNQGSCMLAKSAPYYSVLDPFAWAGNSSLQLCPHDHKGTETMTAEVLRWTLVS